MTASAAGASSVHMIILPGGGYAGHALFWNSPSVPGEWPFR